MNTQYTTLPVYAQKEKILTCLENNQVVIVESPTGSGKTTQIPIILYEAGYANTGTIGITQPRRIATLSVSEFISKQLNTSYPGLVGYKMRFDDVTSAETRIKIMTDGILLQELKLDPLLTKYSVLMIDEAHERSLNIDFVLGLVKRIIQQRHDFRVIISSATINTEIFSNYFNNAPIVSIKTKVYPVKLVYKPISSGTTTLSEAGSDLILRKINNIISDVLDNPNDQGGILVFLPGEKIIKDCLRFLSKSPIGTQLYLLPLYGRLSKEEQERVFTNAPNGKRKVIVSTNIAETSLTISDITTVIDSGLCKINYYSPRTFTSSLLETQISKASCDQRKGRAGRTQPGTCYRLYSEYDYKDRIQYTTEEIFRTDLSEVVLRMAELGITDFYNFDFISKPERRGITGAIETLNMLGALEQNKFLSPIGEMMTLFPLEPRVSRIIVESIMRFPDVISIVLIASAFLSTSSPFILPPNEEMQARQAHHRFNDIQGDFVSYLNLYRAYISSKNKEEFCKKNYLDYRIMTEIQSIYFQLLEIVNKKMGIPIANQSININQYLCCIATGMIQFVCIRIAKDSTYRTLTEDKICIHPSSCMFKQNPMFFVAGEIVKTTRTYAMSVSPLTKKLIAMINSETTQRLIRKQSLLDDLDNFKNSTEAHPSPIYKSDILSFPKGGQELLEKVVQRRFIQNEIEEESKNLKIGAIKIGYYTFKITVLNKNHIIEFPIKELLEAFSKKENQKQFWSLLDYFGTIHLQDNGILLENQKMETIIKVVKNLYLEPLTQEQFDRSFNANIYDLRQRHKLIDYLGLLFRITVAKERSNEYGFVTLYNNGKGDYWFKINRGFHTCLAETHSSLETIIEEDVDFSPSEIEKINTAIGFTNKLYL